jgi:hypothetical protein
MQVEVTMKDKEENNTTMRYLDGGTLFVFTTGNFRHKVDDIMIKCTDIDGYNDAEYLCLSTGRFYDGLEEGTDDSPVKDVSKQFILKGWL